MSLEEKMPIYREAIYQGLLIRIGHTDDCLHFMGEFDEHVARFYRENKALCHQYMNVIFIAVINPYPYEP